MQHRNIAAHTTPPPEEYPEFVSINQHLDSTVSITVRGPKRFDGSVGFVVPGQVVEMKMTAEDALKLFEQAVKSLKE